MTDLQPIDWSTDVPMSPKADRTVSTTDRLRLREAISRCMRDKEHSCSEAALVNYDYHFRRILDHFGNIPLDDITVRTMSDWRNVLAEDDSLSRVTHNGTIKSARVLFNWLRDMNYIDVSPTRHLDKLREPDRDIKAISEANIDKMLAAAAGSSYRNLAIISLLADCGCRASELLSMRTDRLDLEAGTAQVTGKTGRHSITFFEGTKDALRSYLRYEREDWYGPDLWIGTRGPLEYEGLYRMTEAVAKAAGVEKPWSPHAFRHAVGIRATKAGGIKAAATILNHETIQTTHEYYSQFDAEESAQLARQFASRNGHMPTPAPTPAKRNGVTRRQTPQSQPTWE